MPPILRPIRTTHSPTIYPTSNPIPFIDQVFIDDFECDAQNGILGWSNCNQINSKYHGPFSSIDSVDENIIMFREFQCNPFATVANITFSNIFDCNVAFNDEVLVYIDDKLISSYSSASYDEIINDPDLLSISDCNWYIDRNITYSINVSTTSFQLKFETLFKTNVVKNIVISDIQIHCLSFIDSVPMTSQESVGKTITTDTISTNQPLIHSSFIDRDKVLKCTKYYIHSTSKNQIDTISTIYNRFLAFSERHSTVQSNAELCLSPFDFTDTDTRTLKGDNWYLSIRLEVNKQQIIVQNRTSDEIIQTIFPSMFRIKDEDNCYLDITIEDKNNDLFDSEMDVFWNCNADALNIPIWHFNTTSNLLYNAEWRLYLTWHAERNKGFEIDQNEKNALATDKVGQFGIFYIIDDKIAFVDPDRLSLGDICQLTKDDNQV